MSEISQPPTDIQTQDPNSRVNRLNAASDHNANSKQTAEQQGKNQNPELEAETVTFHHDPAVTLASTLAKLDQGSKFTAKYQKTEIDGRPVITSELGTYLVELDNKQINDFKKIHKDDLLEIRIISIGKEIKAEIIHRPRSPEENIKPTIITAILTLTDLGPQIEPKINHPSQISELAQTPLDDIRSQYNATTLFKAERMAREIGEKLDNLPLPTTSPNYVVYGTTDHSTSTAGTKTRQVSANISIQEISAPIVADKSSVHSTANISTEQILGKSVNVEVIKTIPKENIALPGGLPASVIKEINSLTPLDYVAAGQKLTINIAALAIPETEKTAERVINTAAAQPLSNAQRSLTTATKADNSDAAPAPKNISTEQQSVKDTVISGIVIDRSQSNIKPVSTEITSPIIPNAYSHPNMTKNTADLKNTQSPQIKNYYIATPTTVLKFQSEIPLIAGTIVSFTVGDKNSPAVAPQTDIKTVINTDKNISVTENKTISSPTGQIETTNTKNPQQIQPNVIPAQILQKIDHFMPQPLDQLIEDWGSISLALNALSASMSPQISAILSSRIPNLQSPGQLTSTMFFFLSALKAPHPARTWLGPDVSSKLVQLGGKKIIDKINHDFSRLARLAVENAASDWRPHLIPLQNGNDISAIPILIKQINNENEENKNNDQNDDNNNKIKATRFILELTLSQFGTLLIDGLLKGPRLDIIIKSVKPISLSIKMKLTKQYNDALAKNKFDGEMIIIDNTPADVSVKKIIEIMTHKTSIEKKI